MKTTKLPELYLSTTDHRRLTALLGGLTKPSESLVRLRGEIARAVLLDPAAVPATAVGLDSEVELLDLDSREHERYTLTMPAAADPDQRRLSVLAPVGTALLGYSEGDEIAWPTPGGIRRLKLLRVTRAPAG